MYVALIGNKKLELKAKVILIVGRKMFLFFFFNNKISLPVKGEVEENPLCSCFLCKAFATTSEFPF